MNKAEFLAGLRDALAGKLPSGELEDVLSYYEEYFADAGEEHEAEAAEGLGSPASVAAQVLEGRTGQAPSAASAERRPRRLWPVVLGICAAALLLLGVGIRLVFLAQRMPDAPAAGERQPVAAGQEPVVVEQDPVSTPPENKLELEPFTALDIDVGIGDIRMEEGDGWYLSLTSGGQDGDGTPYRLNHSQSGDTLEIWSTPENISGDGSPKGEVVLTVPEGTVLNRAEISIGVGALDWSGCAVEGLLTGRTPPDELERILAYYTEYFDEAGPQGEGRVIRELGTPAELVGRVLGAQRSRTVPAERDCPPEGAARERHGLGTLWKVLLAICAAPIAIPLILVVVAMVLGLVVLILALVAGVAVGGVVAIGAGVFTACAGFSVLFSAGLPTMMFFCGVGLLSSGVGLLLIAGSFLLAGLCFRGMAALLGRWLNRREVRA